MTDAVTLTKFSKFFSKFFIFENPEGQ